MNVARCRALFRTAPLALTLALLALPCAAAAQNAATPYPLVSPADPADARGRNLVILDSVVFVLGVAILGGVLAYWGLRIYREK